MKQNPKFQDETFSKFHISNFSIELERSMMVQVQVFMTI